MSRTVHKLLSGAWWGGWARWFTLENREMRRRGRRKRRQIQERDAQQEADRWRSGR